MHAIVFPRFGVINAGMMLGAALAALTALTPQANAAQPTASFDRPASYDIRDRRSSGPVGAVPVSRTAKSGSVAARDSRCDIRDVCSETPPTAVKTTTERADASDRNPACDVRDTCTSSSAPLFKAEATLRLSRDGNGNTVTR